VGEMSLKKGFLMAGGVLLVVGAITVQLINTVDTDSAGFPITDTQAWADARAGASAVGWLDDGEVAFISTEGGHPEKPGLPKVIAIWNVQHGLRAYRKGVLSLCVGPGTLAYMMEGEAHRVFFGKPGHEVEVDSQRISPATCLPRADGVGSGIVPLLPDHGVLDLGPSMGAGSSDNRPLRFLKTGTANLIELPFGKWEGQGFRYYAYKNAYFITGTYYDKVGRYGTSWPKMLPRPMWWLSSDGSLSTITVEPPWNQMSDFAYFPTRIGLVVTGVDKRKKHPRFPADAGLFLLTPDGSAQTLFKGFAEGIAVSPGGCRIAFIHRNIKSSPGPNAIKIIRIC
jgi:hypothetical protein